MSEAPHRRFKRWLLAALALAIVGLDAWVLWLEPSSLRVRTYAIELPRWPSACSDLRIAVLGDLHVGAPYIDLDKLERIVALTNAQHPDLVLIPGDLVITGIIGGTELPPERITPVLQGLSARAGVFAVLGNHDWWLSGARTKRAYEEQGIRVLENEAREITVGGCSLWLAGIGDLFTGHSRPGAALAGVPEAATVIAFTHNPDVFPQLPQRIALTVAAHTHGGQVWLPFIGRPIVPSHFGQRFAAGHIVENDRHLFVHTGIGTSVLPIRFRVPPEIAVLLLKPAR